MSSWKLKIAAFHQATCKPVGKPPGRLGEPEPPGRPASRAVKGHSHRCGPLRGRRNPRPGVGVTRYRVGNAHSYGLRIFGRLGCLHLSRLPPVTGKWSHTRRPAGRPDTQAPGGSSCLQGTSCLSLTVHRKVFAAGVSHG